MTVGDVVVATVRRPRDGRAAAVSGAVYLALAPLAAAGLSRPERVGFLAVNRFGGRMPALRVPQQLGTPWVLPLVAVTAFVARRPHLAVSAGLALPLEKALEVGVKKLTRRRRPAQLAPEARLFDDAPVDGPSYPSGHAAIATCAVLLAAPYLPRPVLAALSTAVGLTAVTRVHQGAHFPLDAVGGVSLGVCVAALLQYTFGLPASGA